MTKNEIIAKLEELGIEFDKLSNKPELLALLPAETPVEVVEEVKAEAKVVPESEARKELIRIYAASKAANPKQYALKNKDAQLETKLAKL